MSNATTEFTTFFKRHGSTILTCLAAAGTIGTAILVGAETPKALKLIADAQYEKGEPLTAMEKVKVAAPVYIPAITMGVSTVACIFGANVLSQKQTTAMASAYALVNSSYNEYRNKLIELYGGETDAKIKEEILRDKYNAHPDPIYAPGLLGHSNDLASECDKKERALFYDDLSGRYFESTLLDVFSAEYHLNRNFTLGGVANPNEFYEFLGIPTTDFGEAIGWTSADGYYWLDFDHKRVVMDDGLECYIIYCAFSPEEGYLDR